MKITIKLLIFAFFVLCQQRDTVRETDEIFTSLTVDAQTANIEFYWKDNNGENLKSIGNLKKFAANNGKRLRFAMNGGMYQEGGKPLGVFIQDGKIVTPLNLRRAEGNFYLQPNGVFYLTNEKQAFVVTTADFQKELERDADRQSIGFATQSGPMLVIEGQINSEFKIGSSNLYIRNGVCILENGRVIFAISRRRINFYDFAAYFKNAGCRNALYLDGFVSRMYTPESNITETDGDFGVIIGIAE